MSGIIMPYLGILGQLGYIPKVGLDAQYISDYADAANFGTNIPANAGGVKTWVDIASALHDANQAVSTKQPKWYSNQLNGLGSILWDGANDLLSINPIAFLQNLPGATMYVVAKNVATSGTPVMITSDQNGFKIAISGGNYNIGFAGGAATTTVAADTTSYHVYGLVFDGTQSNANVTTQNNLRLKFRYNGVQEPLTFTANVNTVTSGAGTYIYMGCDSTGGANFWNGYICNVLFWTRTLSASECNSVETYLGSYWGIAA